MYILVDSHQDLAWNMLTFGRDYTRSARETRQLEKSSLSVERNGDTLLGWPEYQQARVAIIFATLFSTPERFAYEWEPLVYADGKEAHKQYLQQIELYHRLCDDQPDKFRLIGSASDLEETLSVLHLAGSKEDSYPVGLLPLMEGGDGILTIDELAEWWDMGVRLISPAWAGTRFCGGTKEPGPLTSEGRGLLSAMAEVGFILDLSHMDESAALEALDRYPGSIVATHANCLALLPEHEFNRHLSDRLIRGLIERDGIIGVVPFNTFLKDGWLVGKSRREEVSLEALVDHIDHICQLAGDASHVGIGSDFDGGFGLGSTPIEIDTIQDLHLLSPLLEARGYTEVQIAGVLGQNWIKHITGSLPA
jgi:membrane dipeptidase